jgi:hypothetical protein
VQLFQNCAASVGTTTPMVGVSFEAMAGLAASRSGAASARNPLRIRFEMMRSSSWGSLR